MRVPLHQRYELLKRLSDVRRDPPKVRNRRYGQYREISPFLLRLPRNHPTCRKHPGTGLRVLRNHLWSRSNT
jgi:hypothetical protein